MPSAGDDGGLALWARRAEEVDGLVVRIGETYGDDEMTSTDVELRDDHPSDMKLLQCDLTTFLYFRLVFAVFGVLQFVGCTCATIFKLNLGTQDPLWRELVVESQYEAGDGYRVVVLLGIAFLVTIETVNAIILEISNHLAIAAKTESVVTKCVWLGSHHGVRRQNNSK